MAQHHCHATVTMRDHLLHHLPLVWVLSKDADSWCWAEQGTQTLRRGRHFALHPFLGEALLLDQQIGRVQLLVVKAPSR